MGGDKKEQDMHEETKILFELLHNSNNNIETIAKHSGLSRQKVYRTIKRLEEHHTIWGYSAVVDENQQGLQKFMLLLKRSPRPISQKLLDEILSSKREDLYIGFGVTIVSSYFLHGDYDWAIIFLAKDLRTAKKFSNTLTLNRPDIIVKMDLQQILFTQREHHIFNPDSTKLREFL